MQEIADSSVAGAQRGALGTVEVQRLELDARALGEEVETATNDLAETRADITRLEQDVDARQLEYRQARGSIEEAMERDGIRIASHGPRSGQQQRQRVRAGRTLRRHHAPPPGERARCRGA